MSQFTIIGTPLYQWESGRKLRITPLRGMTVDSVHFSNYGDSTALVVKPKEENGHYIADIPNILLQDDQNIVVYSVNVSDDKVETIKECVFPVRKRAKPSSYVYTETEIMNYTTLEKRVKALEEGVCGSVGGNVPDSEQNANGGLNNTAKALLITILRNGVYSTDQSENITALEAALATPEIPESGVNQDGSILSVVSGVTVAQTDSILAIA